MSIYVSSKQKIMQISSLPKSLQVNRAINTTKHSFVIWEMSPEHKGLEEDFPMAKFQSLLCHEAKCTLTVILVISSKHLP